MQDSSSSTSTSSPGEGVVAGGGGRGVGGGSLQTGLLLAMGPAGQAETLSRMPETAGDQALAAMGSEVTPPPRAPKGAACQAALLVKRPLGRGRLEGGVSVFEFVHYGFRPDFFCDEMLRISENASVFLVLESVLKRYTQ